MERDILNICVILLRQTQKVGNFFPTWIIKQTLLSSYQKLLTPNSSEEKKQQIILGFFAIIKSKAFTQEKTETQRYVTYLR